MDFLVRPAVALCVLVALAGLLALAPKTAVESPDMPAFQVEPHPLDPLSAEEVRAAVAVVKASPEIDKQAFFPTVVLKEPSKVVVYNHQSGEAFPREALVIALDRPVGRT